ncbi:TonB-dependent receptor [Aquicella siphonis]|nr:TonB-dependent receptor [Aquicella siphonis]
MNAVHADSEKAVIPDARITLAKKPSGTSTSGPQQIISRSMLSAAGMTTLSQALKSLGGLQLHDTTGTNNQVLLSMRGFGANAGNNTLLLINGIPINNPDMAPPDLNLIPISEIEFIRIIFGSESVLYGDQAVGGVIDVATRGQAEQAMMLSCNAGSYDQRDCLASVRYQAFRLNLGSMHTDNYRQRNRADQRILSGSIHEDYSRGRLDMNFHLARNNMQYPGALSAAQVRQNRRQAVNDTDFFNNSNVLVHAAQQYALTPDWLFTTDLAIRQMNGNGTLTSPFTQFRDLFFLKPQTMVTRGNVTFTSGADLQKDRYQLNTQFGTTNDRLQKYGLFSLVNFTPRPQFAFSAGARAAMQSSRLSSLPDQDTRNRAAATTLGGTYQPASDLAFYLRRAESFRFPNADEIASTPPGVTGLKTQRGTAYETGVEMTREKYTGKMEFYLLTLKDEIMFDPFQTPQQPFGTNTNLDPTTRRGMRLSGEYHFNNRLTLDAQYHYVNARFQSGLYKGKRIPLVSENFFRTGVHEVLSPHWSVYLETVYTGNQYADSDNANTAGATGGYTLLNANLRFEYAQFAAALHANNIFNKNYYLYTIYQTTMQTEFFYPAPDRNLILTMSYTFK